MNNRWHQNVLVRNDMIFFLSIVKYYTQVFYKCQSPQEWEMFFVISKDNPENKQVSYSQSWNSKFNCVWFLVCKESVFWLS